ncbi:hypothetical protein D9M68_839450 [compost metagenome]
MRIAEEHDPFLVPDIEMPDPELLVDQADQLAHFAAPPLGHFQVECAGDVEAFEILHPVERHMIVAPAAAHRNGNFVRVLALEIPIIDRCDMLDQVHRVGHAIGLVGNQGHWPFPCWFGASVECARTIQRIANADPLSRLLRRSNRPHLKGYTALLIQAVRRATDGLFSCG